MIKRGIVFATDILEGVLDLAFEAEQAGLDRVWTTEYRGRDAVARALAIALRTERIGVGTGVAYAFTRAPLAMAALAADVHRLAQGRFSLGLSPGTRGVRRWYGVDFEPPAARTTDYLTELRRIWEDADTYPLVPRLYLPAFNSIMTRHAARIADGLLLHPLAVGSVHRAERLLPAIERGASERSERPELVAWQVVSIAPDEDVARRRAAAQLAFYLSTPSYAVAVKGTPWQEVAVSIRDASQEAGGRPDWQAIGRVVPDDMIDEFTIAGEPAHMHRRLAAVESDLASAGVAEVVFQTVGAGLSEAQVLQNCRSIIEATSLNNRAEKVGK